MEKVYSDLNISSLWKFILLFKYNIVQVSTFNKGTAERNLTNEIKLVEIFKKLKKKNVLD